MKKRILIIDDDSCVREALKKVLDEAGYLAAAVGDGTEGLGKLQSDRFDLLLLDLNLPGMNGFDILDITEIRYPSLPIIILTGVADQCEPGSLAGADALFEKPPDVPAMLAAIEQLLRQDALPRVRVATLSLRQRPGARAQHNPLVLPGLFTASTGAISHSAKARSPSAPPNIHNPGRACSPKAPSVPGPLSPTAPSPARLGQAAAPKTEALRNGAELT